MYAAGVLWSFLVLCASLERVVWWYSENIGDDFLGVLLSWVLELVVVSCEGWNAVDVLDVAGVDGRGWDGIYRRRGEMRPG